MNREHDGRRSLANFDIVIGSIRELPEIAIATSGRRFGLQRAFALDPRWFLEYSSPCSAVDYFGALASLKFTAARIYFEGVPMLSMKTFDPRASTFTLKTRFAGVSCPIDDFYKVVILPRPVTAGAKPPEKVLRAGEILSSLADSNLPATYFALSDSTTAYEILTLLATSRLSRAFIQIGKSKGLDFATISPV